MDAEKIYLVPETHWDREWYLSFQEFRARLVLMMDKLLKILKNDPNYTNFTLDGQCIPLEDYLEVRPHKRELLEEFVKKKKLSVGPFYVLPDEFLVSGESLIRNLMIGNKIANNFGRVMKAGYIPDPFGHIAQLPQILYGCEIPSVLFWRGFGDEFENLNLDLEFEWQAPGNAASILAIHLISSYGSLADLDTSKRKGEYRKAIRRIKKVVAKLEEYTSTPYVLLNNGSDHTEAQPEIPNVINEWNDKNPEKPIEQNDFEKYINKIIEYDPSLKSFQGELRGGKYAPLLSGVFSTRMWIKQRNTEIEYLYEKYTEPIATISWILDQQKEYEFPSDYILTGLKWLIKNHPHDSICGCSIDQVHNEMTTRFDWSEQIANEVIKNSCMSLSKIINLKENSKSNIPLIVFNPLPWKRKDVVRFNGITAARGAEEFPDKFKLIDADGSEIEYQSHKVKEVPRYTQESNLSSQFSFLAEVPACGYKVYYIKTDKSPREFRIDELDFDLDNYRVENQFYKIIVSKSGKIKLIDKETDEVYEDLCFIEDVGDWGDEYDYSGPKDNQMDIKYTSEDADILSLTQRINGPTQKTIELSLRLKLPSALTEDRYKRENVLVDNYFKIYLSIYDNIKRVDFRIEVQNNSRDHRLRVLFPSKLVASKIFVDGHFYVIPREISLPNGDNWVQKPLPTNHQKDFVALQEDNTSFSITNKGLPEYEAIMNEDGTITIAITLLRCVEWLSRDGFETRGGHAGPQLKTPGAQCIGNHIFELALLTVSNKNGWMDSLIHKKAKEFNNPLLPVFPTMAATPLRFMDKVLVNPTGIMSIYVGNNESNLKRYLPEELSFLELENDKVMLSILKKADNDGDLIIRVYNLSENVETTSLKLFNKLIIKNAQLVNFLEESPKNKIKANIDAIEENKLFLTLEPHVIATLKLEIKCKVEK